MNNNFMFNFSQTKKLLNQYKIPLVKNFLLKSDSQLDYIKKYLSWPIVIKISNQKIIHKTEIKGVAKVNNEQEFKDKFNQLSQIKGNEGIVVQPFIRGIEIIIGMKKDAQFGPVLMFGLGGILVELFKDVSFRIAPVKIKEAREMIKEIKLYPILNGYRGQEKINTNQLAKILVNLSKLSLKEKAISQIDFNPIIVNSKEALVVDAKII